MLIQKIVDLFDIFNPMIKMITSCIAKKIWGGLMHPPHIQDKNYDWFNFDLINEKNPANPRRAKPRTKYLDAL